MKKNLMVLILLVLSLFLCSCASNKDYSKYVVDKIFLYEYDGFYGEFTIKIQNDGTFCYYEGPASSYFGMGNWTIDKNIITLEDRNRTNVFEIRKGKIIWIADGSSNFSYIKVKDGEAFNEVLSQK